MKYFLMRKVCEKFEKRIDEMLSIFFWVCEEFRLITINFSNSASSEKGFCELWNAIVEVLESRIRIF